MNIEEMGADNMLDENGEPFFEPIDWGTMALKARDNEAPFTGL